MSNTPWNPDTNYLYKQHRTNWKQVISLNVLDEHTHCIKPMQIPGKGKYHLNKLVFMQALPSYKTSVYSFYLNEVIQIWLDS